MKALILVAYSIVLFFLQPLACVYLLWRARKQPEYARHWGERFALYGKKRIASATRRIWIHAVSLGETRAAAPLIEALFAEQPDVHIILTHTTPTGRAAGQSLFSTFLNDGRMTQVYVPYDVYGAVARFFRTFAPTDVWVMETEVWPNMVAAANRRGIPIHLVNGRLSEKSLKQTLKFPRLMGAAYRGFNSICAQTNEDAVRYRQLGVSPERIVVTGNLKFDMKPSAEQVEAGERLKQLTQQLNQNRRIVVLASTREGEEALWLDALREVQLPDIQWWVVPRHPQRFDEVAALIEGSKIFVTPLLRKSHLDRNSDEAMQTQLAQAQVVLGDTMGQMFMYYALADVVMMGGAWLPFGGQNFLEPLSIGKPTVMGEHTYNFAQIAHEACHEGALVQCTEFVQGLMAVQVLLYDIEQYAYLKDRAQVFYKLHQGAVVRTMHVLITKQ